VTFPLLDLLFGTFHMPAGEVPREFGVGESEVPAGFWGQLVEPFRTSGPLRWAVAAGVFVAASLIGALESAPTPPANADRSQALPHQPATPKADGRSIP